MTEPTTDAPAAVEDTQSEPTAPQTEAKPTGLPDDVDALRSEITKLRRENAAARTNAKQSAAAEARQQMAQEIGKALGILQDEEVDPARLAEQLTAQTATAREAQLELAVFRAAATAGADAAQLLDSRSFLAKVRDLDPTDASGISAAVAEAVESDRRFRKASPPVPVPNPMQGLSGSSGPATFTRAQLSDPRFYQANKDEIFRALREGRIQD